MDGDRISSLLIPNDSYNPGTWIATTTKSSLKTLWIFFRGFALGLWYGWTVNGEIIYTED